MLVRFCLRVPRSNRHSGRLPMTGPFGVRGFVFPSQALHCCFILVVQARAPQLQGIVCPGVSPAAPVQLINIVQGGEIRSTRLPSRLVAIAYKQRIDVHGCFFFHFIVCTTKYLSISILFKGPHHIAYLVQSTDIHRSLIFQGTSPLQITTAPAHHSPHRPVRLYHL
ncbi:uncharacterized protein BO80DRAFT_146139 [Aspergillus ibericus CBS 121593]|uniref:Uncharacterized protein n=1 Tax=Aspergillus ibericus CBS 121593 TaxID=1448316 RepID=A0A395GTT5_9EURO|nr:hypothetical protein BO80DRAFT_146139 [Aspergillus ibericus CBS 121593]RAK98839.1 hypothetical protein BO80DRAFT_146139 [Aspergillus ibericus CBS 121593]